jgi:hypothetical protein
MLVGYGTRNSRQWQSTDNTTTFCVSASVRAYKQSIRTRARCRQLRPLADSPFVSWFGPELRAPIQPRSQLVDALGAQNRGSVAKQQTELTRRVHILRSQQ